MRPKTGGLKNIAMISEGGENVGKEGLNRQPSYSKASAGKRSDAKASAVKPEMGRIFNLGKSFG